MKVLMLGTLIGLCMSCGGDKVKEYEQDKRVSPSTAGNTVPVSGNQPTTQQPAGTTPGTTTTPTNNTPNTPAPTTPAATTVSYAKDIKPLMTKSCEGANCHTGPNPAVNPPLSTFADVKGNYTKSLDTIQKGSMPKGRTMTQTEKDLFKAWGTGNFPQ